MSFRTHLTGMVLALCAWPAFAAGHPVGLFYMTSDAKSIRDFFAHSSQIDLLVPAWYQVDENGLVTGAPEPAVLAQAQSEKLPVMPIVALFNKRNFHLLATSAAAQAQMNAALVRECKLHGYSGFQFDIEDVEWTDRDALTALVATTYGELHKSGLQLSIATVPNAPGYPGSGGFAKWIYTDWRGADDLRPEHAVDHTRPGRWLAMDRRQLEIRAAVCAEGEVVAGDSALRLPLVHGRTGDSFIRNTGRTACREAQSNGGLHQYAGCAAAGS